VQVQRCRCKGGAGEEMIQVQQSCRLLVQRYRGGSAEVQQVAGYRCRAGAEQVQSRCKADKHRCSL